jgi:hypothetical protein
MSSQKPTRERIPNNNTLVLRPGHNETLQRLMQGHQTRDGLGVARQHPHTLLRLQIPHANRLVNRPTAQHTVLDQTNGIHLREYF